MVHGAAICEAAFSSRWLEHRPPKEIIQGRIREVLAEAGAPTRLTDVDEKALRWCWWHPCRTLVLHFVMALVVFIFIVEGIDRARPGWAFRPLSAVYRTVLPEPIFDRNIDKIATDVAASACNGKVAQAENRLRDGTLSRVTITVASHGVGDYLRAELTKRPPACNHDISCEFTFRGQFTQFNIGETVTVVGRLDKIYPPEPGRNVYIDFKECYAE